MFEYKKEFTVGGNYGFHVGPAARIAEIVQDYWLLYEIEDLEVRIQEKGRKETADASNPYELIALIGSSGNILEVVASTKSSERRKDLTKVVEKIGEIIVNTDKYTIRQHQ